MKKKESIPELAIGSRHPEAPYLFLIGWAVIDGDRAMDRREARYNAKTHGLAMFDTRAKARSKATRLGLTHDAAKPCWAEAFAQPVPKLTAEAAERLAKQ